jgi:hypothetical protein
MKDLLKQVDEILEDLREQVLKERNEKEKRRLWKKIDKALDERLKLTNPAS